MSFAEKFERAFRSLLPSPFTIAILLTLVTMVLALLFGKFESGLNPVVQLLDSWQTGLWDASLLAFAVQMMLILVLGHILALATPVSRAIDSIITLASSPARAAFLVTFFTMVVGFFNWGLGLIFGAIIARKTAEKFSHEGKQINYPLLGAAGYTGMMIWHGGISGSAPVKVVEEGHLPELMAGIFPPERLETLRASIPFELTIFSPMNITASVILLIVLPLMMAYTAKHSKSDVPLPEANFQFKSSNKPLHLSGAEKLDYSRFFCLFFAFLILGYSLSVPFREANGFGFITLNYLNFTLLGLCLLFHGRFSNFLNALDEAISGASGILIQFPLYFGIMGIMRSAGLIDQISEFFISVSTEVTFPIYTFFSAGLVNIFVPSGGGQWAVQGPIIIQAADQLGVSFSKSIMALAYGDQLTNMLQPFWALPLLGITGLKARDILPYTLRLLMVGMIVFMGVLILF